MNARGAGTIRGLGRVFNTTGDSGARRITAQEFYVGINECGVKLDKHQCDGLLNELDSDKEGTVNYDAFLVLLRGCPNASRTACIGNVFNRFDSRGAGCLVASDLRVSYASNQHPRVIAGAITEDEAFLEFLANFGDKNNNGQITRTEWNDFYAAVSDSIENDAHFCQLVSAAWNVPCE